MEKEGRNMMVFNPFYYNILMWQSSSPTQA
jgi:hypothetical protein